MWYLGEKKKWDPGDFCEIDVFFLWEWCFFLGSLFSLPTSTRTLTPHFGLLGYGLFKIHIQNRGLIEDRLHFLSAHFVRPYNLFLWDICFFLWYRGFWYIRIRLPAPRILFGEIENPGPTKKCNISQKKIMVSQKCWQKSRRSYIKITRYHSLWHKKDRSPPMIRDRGQQKHRNER